MSLDEFLFKKAHTWWHNRKRSRLRDPEVYATLGEHKRRLEMFLSLARNEPIRVAESGVLEAPLLNHLPLPSKIAVLETTQANADIYTWRALHYLTCLEEGISVPATAGVQHVLADSRRAQVCQHPRLLDLARALGLRAHQVETFQKLQAQWLAARHARYDPADPLNPCHLVGLVPLNQRLSTKGHPASPLMPQVQEESVRSKTRRVPTASRPERLAMEEKEASPLVHVFEKLLTADNYQGGRKQHDDTDFMEASDESLSELRLRYVMRSSGTATSTLDSDATLSGPMMEADGESQGEVSREAILYPEWDVRRGSYKEAWCQVFEREGERGTSSVKTASHALAEVLKRKVDQALNDNAWVSKQKEGSDLDMDAVTAEEISRRGQGYVSQRIFMHRRPIERQVSLLVLLDTSMSTDAWVSAHRTKDVLDQAMALFPKLFEDFHEQIAIAGFRSFTRKRCEWVWVKRFSEAWPVAQERQSVLTPQGHTRIGPFLRHAQKHLLKANARKRAVIVLSDARPSDLDAYEGTYGEQDVSRAVHELEAAQIHVRALISAPKVTLSMVHQFGVHRCRLVTSPMDIGAAVTDTLLDLIRH